MTRPVIEYVAKGCACGDRIVAISRLPLDVADAVRAHNQTRRHREWRAKTFADDPR